MEVSSHCDASCIYCPHTAYKEQWQNRYLPMEAFQNLIPAFVKTRLVYLQGWGEPCTHPHFFDMLRMAKKADCMVGTTTNGTLINQKLIEKLVNEGLDIIGFSLAGVDEKNDLIRKGTQLKQILECIDQINRIKNKLETDNPKIHLAYMLLRSGLNDLEKIPAFLGNTGASETVISSLSLVVNPPMEAESILVSDKNEYLELKHRLIEVRDASANQGAKVHFHIVSPNPKQIYCSENISQAIVVGSDGKISPCVMAQIPTKGENFYYFKGQKQILQSCTFGNILNDSLNNIWNKKEYKHFVRTFLRDEAPTFCQNCLKRFIDNLE